MIFSAQDREESLLAAVILLVVGTPLMFPYILAPFFPRKSWTWIVGIILIAFGMTSACCIPIYAPLLIYWVKPETKQYFGAT